MAIRVMIERRIKKGKEMNLVGLLLDLRSRAILQNGYIAEETLRDYEDPSTYIVISTWEMPEHWKRWSNKEERMEIQSEIEELLTEPPRTRIYELLDLPLTID